MNWISKTLTADNYFRYANYRFPGQPWENIDTALVEIPDAPHNIAGRPSQLITKIDHFLAWFAKYPIDDTTDD